MTTWRGIVRTNPSHRPASQPATTATCASQHHHRNHCTTRQLNSVSAFWRGRRRVGVEGSWETEPSQLAATSTNQYSLLAGQKCNQVWSKRARLPVTSDPHVAILTQPRGTSRGRRCPVVHESPFPSRNGGHTYLRRIRRAGGFPSGKVPFSSLDLALPSSACACCCAVASLPPAPEKTRGHGPAPVTAQVVPSPVPVPEPEPVVVTISIWSVLQKLSIDYLIVEWHAQCQHP